MQFIIGLRNALIASTDNRASEHKNFGLKLNGSELLRYIWLSAVEVVPGTL